MTGNYAQWAGGGIYLESTLAQFENVSIIDNRAELIGGGISLWWSNPYFDRVILANNQVPDTSGEGYGYGGAVYCEASSPMFRNTLFTGNSAKENGTVLYCENDSHPILVNVTVAGNESMYGTFGSTKYLISCYNSDADILNSIFFDNDTLLSGTLLAGDITVSYSNMEKPAGTVWYGEGNINQDPLFEGSGDHPYQLTAGSPCIDAGHPDTSVTGMSMWDLMGNYRLWDGDADGDTIVDMGPYEFGSVGVNTPEFQAPNTTFQINCFPNPTYEIVHFEFEIRIPSRISIQVFNAVGGMVAELSDGILVEGRHRITWNTAILPSGLYFCKVQAGKEAVGIKLIKQ